MSKCQLLTQLFTKSVVQADNEKVAIQVVDVVFRNDFCEVFILNKVGSVDSDCWIQHNYLLSRVTV